MTPVLSNIVLPQVRQHAHAQLFLALTLERVNMQLEPKGLRTALNFEGASRILLPGTLKVYMELGSYFLFLQEQIKDIIIIGGRFKRLAAGHQSSIAVCCCW